MNNQVAALQAANIRVATLNSNTLSTDRVEIINDLCCGMSFPPSLDSCSFSKAPSRNQGHPLTRLLYITPEYTLTESFRRHLETVYLQGELARIAIDEAHCISEWGHDFRPAYAHLSYFRAAYPSVPIMCLTATATSSVRNSIISTLNLNTATLRTFLAPTTRPNLHYEIRFTSDDASDFRFSSLLSWIQAIHTRRSTDPRRALELAATRTRSDAVSGIVYVPFRTDCDALALRLRNHSIGAAPYHAGLSAFDRASCQRKWIANEAGYDIIIATTAFGMGIDKQDVRFVVHWSIPKSFEGYYQEVGRAGRDGKAALCILFYAREERDRVAWRMSKDTGSNNLNDGGKEAQVKRRMESFQKLVAYCEVTGRCRHAIISEFFGEQSTPECDCACDFCKEGEGLRVRKCEGLASEEWVSTQRERDDFFGDDYD